MTYRWQDIVGLVLGLILVALPFLAGFTATAEAAASSAWALGIATVVFFAIALARRGRWEEWVNLVLALLLLLSPFVLGFTGVAAAAWSHWALAVLIGGDAAWALARPGHGRHSPA